MNTSRNEILERYEASPSCIFHDTEESNQTQAIPISARTFMGNFRQGTTPEKEAKIPTDFQSPIIIKKPDSFKRPKTIRRATNEIDSQNNVNNPFKIFNLEENTITLTEGEVMLKCLSPEIKLMKSKIESFISLLYLTKKFIRNIRNATIFRRPTWLKPFHFSIINDRSFFGKALAIDIVSENSATEFLRGICAKFINLISSESGMLHPTGWARLLFDFLILTITFACLFVIPIDLGFNIDLIRKLLETFDPDYQYLLKRVVVFVYLGEVLVNLNTAYFEKGELIKSRLLILKHYLRQSFLSDIISILYFVWGLKNDYPYQDSFHRLTGILFILRTENISRIFERIEEFLFLDEKNHHYLSFIRLIFRIAILSHFFACIWNFIGMNTSDSWISRMELESSDWGIRYLISFYYIVVVMNTVGFGDITPKNIVEIGFTIVFIYVACGLFAYTINSIGIILQNINKTKQEFRRNMFILNGYMRNKEVNLDLRSKIRNFLEYVWNDAKIHNEEATQKIMNQLSKSLREELLLNANGVILKNLGVLYKNFSEASLRKVVLIMKEVKFIPGDTIYYQNDLVDPYLYIIKEGEVELFIETQGKTHRDVIIEKVGKNQSFGQLSFFSDLPRQTSARCSTFTSVYSINRQNFIDILKEEEQDYEKFCMIRDQIMTYDDLTSLHIACNSCKESTHLTINCPFLHVQFSNHRVISKYNYKSENKRREYERRFKRHHHGVFILENSDSSFEDLGANDREMISAIPQGKSVVFSDKPLNLKTRTTFEELDTSNFKLKTQERWGKIRSALKFGSKNFSKLNKKLAGSQSLNIIELESKLEPSQSMKKSSKSSLKLSSQNFEANLTENSLPNLEKPLMKNSKRECDQQKNGFKLPLYQRDKTPEQMSLSTVSAKIKSLLIPQKLETNYEENAKNYSIFFPNNNFEDVIHHVNILIFRNLTQKELNSKLAIGKMWANFLTKKKNENNSIPPSPKRKSMKVEPSFFKREESNKFSRLKLLKLLRDYKIIIDKKRLWTYIKRKFRQLIGKKK